MPKRSSGKDNKKPRKVRGKISRIGSFVPCGYAKIKDLFRFQFLIRGESVYPISDLLAQIKTSHSDVSCLIDVDPISTYF
jgi:primosomal protein N'